MKKQTNSLTVEINKNDRKHSVNEKVSLLIPGMLMLVGFLGTINQEWNLNGQGILMIIPSAIVMIFSMFINWEKRWQALIVMGSFVVLLLLSILFQQTILGSQAAFLNKLFEWKLLRTGIYQIPYETNGNIMLILVFMTCLFGFLSGQMINAGNPFWLVCFIVPVVLGWSCGWLENGWFIGLYMTGALLLFVKYASGSGKTIFYATIILTILAVVVGGCVSVSKITNEKSRLGRKIENTIHSIRWENTKNPMPEGKISEFGSYRPQNEPMLEVTMEKWTPLYVRGYVAGEYTNEGWEPIESEKLTDDAEDLHIVQENYFYASDQISKAWQSIGKKSDNSVDIQVLDACHAYTYLPYASGNLAADLVNSSDLRNEGTGSPENLAYHVDLYPLQNSYLLQGELAEQKNKEYLGAESTYRDFVYKEYLTIPEDVHKVLKKYISIDEGITTVLAKQSITKLLGEMITYNENIITNIGKKSFPEYVIEVSGEGYSVHYATLAALLMRCCGIPARYVEGYVITPKQAEMMPDGGKLTLTQYDSHAWTEYYLDGVGWLPFDATPGYENILKYKLPSDGIPSENAGLEKNLEAWKELKNKFHKKPLVKEEEKEKNQNDDIREILSIFFVLFLILLIALMIRTVYLRYRLRKRLERCNDQDFRFACACILSYMQDLSNTLGKGTQAAGMNVKEKADRMASMLGDNFEVSELETMLNEVWFSNHEITAFHRETVLGWLDTAKKTWTEKTSILQRLKHRWITCKIL